MTKPIIFGQYAWELPSDWRNVASIFDNAIERVLYFSRNEASFARASVEDLGDLIGAIGLIRQTPTQMRTTKITDIAIAAKSSSLQPKRGVTRTLFSLVTNPLGTSLDVAFNALDKSLTKDDDYINHTLSWVESTAVDHQLEMIWTRASDYLYDAALDRELGRRAYWIAIVWDAQHPLSALNPQFEFTPELANSANSSIDAQLNQIRNSPESLVSLWGQSAGVPAMHYIQNQATYVKKLRRGKVIPEIEAVWNNYVSITRHRQRHIQGFATRMRWSV